jgi:hypothetical protein
MAFRTKKISQMDPKGANLASTDLLEISQLVSGSYVTKSITGAQIAASAPATAWGTITGTLSSQTDLNTALSGKQATVTLTTTGTSGASTFVANTLNVPTYSLSGLGGVPTSRTLTINGTTQDLSADRTFTISTGITIGTTAITSGTVGRVLFEGTGNVVQESANLFWDNTNGRLGIGTSSPVTKIDISDSGTSQYLGVAKFFAPNNTTSGNGTQLNLGINSSLRNSTEWRFVYGGNGFTSNRAEFGFGGVATPVFSIFASGNLAINTTTDAGFKLDVNGTARVKGTGITSATTAFTIQNSAGTNTAIVKDDGYIAIGNTTTNTYIINNPSDAGYFASQGPIFLQQAGTTNVSLIGERMAIGKGASYAVASATLELSSTTRGFLPPRMTTTQKNAIASPSAGLMVYDTTLNLMALYNGTTWTTL